MIQELPQTLSAPGYTRVKLTYQTDHPGTEAGLFLAKGLQVHPPYLGVVYVLIPSHKVYTLLEAYADAFETLRDARVIPLDSKLTAFELDTCFPPEILGYVVG